MTTATGSVVDVTGPTAADVAQRLFDGFFEHLGREHSHYPTLRVDLGDGRIGWLDEVTYDAVTNELVLHVEPDA